MNPEVWTCLRLAMEVMDMMSHASDDQFRESGMPSCFWRQGTVRYQCQFRNLRPSQDQWHMPTEAMFHDALSFWLSSQLGAQRLSYVG